MNADIARLGTAEARTTRGATTGFGAFVEPGGVRFRVMATDADRVELVLRSGTAAGAVDLHPSDFPGVWEQVVPGAAAGDRYQYRLGRGELRPDPASRFQPEGVHGPSEVVDPDAYVWRDGTWTGRAAHELTIYELHVGTFTPQGTFDAARRRLPYLRDLGVTAIELMPVAEFAGGRNWGYDGASPFAPSRSYGRPDDLRSFVDEAHGSGLAVHLDVVYNHLGPEGTYLTQFNRAFVTDRHTTPWGGAVNLDGPGSDLVRLFIIDNACHWIREYHLDGLRLDATHALVDGSPRHFVADLSREVRGAARWPIAIYAEDHRNLNTTVESGAIGWELDGVWADDFHHVMRRLLAGDAHGYFRDYAGTTEELARTIRQGWLYTGQPSIHFNDRRGTDPSRVPMHKFVVCLQNHDQIGNRARGDRLHHRIDPAAWRAASAILLTVPMTPLLFMGQEIAARSPFLYFTDLAPELGRAVTEGRRREFSTTPEFAAVSERERIPDPQAPETFEASRVSWGDLASPEHAAVLALYRALLHLRSNAPALQASAALDGETWAADEDSIVVRRTGPAEAFVIVARLRGAGPVSVAPTMEDASALDLVLSTEDARFATDPRPPAIERSAIVFQRPGAVILSR